jgi:hypothetical protein
VISGAKARGVLSAVVFLVLASLMANPTTASATLARASATPAPTTAVLHGYDAPAQLLSTTSSSKSTTSRATSVHVATSRVNGISTRPVVAAEAGDGRVVIGKVADLTADGAIGPGERTLLDQLPDLGSAKANWGQNSGVLRGEMGRGLPIRDASVDPATGELINNTGFLQAERYLLQDRGWSFDPKTTLWLPPGW